MFKVGDRVKHKTLTHLDEGTIKALSKTGKKATVTWGELETKYNYRGNVYHTRLLEHDIHLLAILKKIKKL